MPVAHAYLHLFQLKLGGHEAFLIQFELALIDVEALKVIIPRAIVEVDWVVEVEVHCQVLNIKRKAFQLESLREHALQV